MRREVPLRFCFNLDRERQALCFAPETLAAIGELVELDAETPERLTDEWLAPRLATADGCITGWGSLPLDADRLAGAPRLRYALHSAGSVRPLVRDDAVWQRGLRVTSAANANGRPVAEFALGLLLCALKDVFRYQAAFRATGPLAWRKTVTTPGYYRTTVGVVGAGNVGRHLLGLLRHHDLRVLLYDPWLDEAGAVALGAEPAGLETMLRASHAVVLVAPNLPQNRHLIGASQLALLPDGATLINPGRGALIDQDALISELRSGRINACLDVTDPEPPPEGSPLYTLPNCVLTPHVAGSLNGECRRLGEQVLEEVRRLVSGRPFENEVTRELLPRLG